MAERLVRGLAALPRGVVEPLVRGADGLYLAFHGALKTFGVVPESGAPPETTTAGGRYGVLEERPGRWPGARILLPEGAVFWYTAESLFRRAALWRALAPAEQVERHLRDAARAVWPDVRERRPRSSILELSVERDGVRTLVKCVETESGFVVVSLGQKATRLRLPPAT